MRSRTLEALPRVNTKSIKGANIMNLKEYLLLLRRNAILIASITLAGCLAGVAISLVLPPKYTSQSELFVSMTTSGAVSEQQMASTFVEERIETYVGMVDSGPVLAPVIRKLDLHESPSELASRISAFSDPRTVLITIEATASSPDAAEQLSKAVSDSLVEFIGKIESSSGSEGNRVELVMTNPPVAPTEADGFAIWVWAAVGLALGFAVSLGLSLLRNALDNKLRSKSDLDAVTSAAVLASIPEAPRNESGSFLTDMSALDLRGEAFRRLRTNLGFVHLDDSKVSLLVTSAQAQEGKSSVSINLAIAMAQAGNRVALVDADLRKPTIATRMGLEGAVGLTTVLVGAAELEEVLQPWGHDELYVLATGELPPNPTELLDSRTMAKLVKHLSDQFDIVIFDGPPLLPVADGLVLAECVGRVLLVSSVGEVKLSDLKEASDNLEVLDIPVSVVLNKVPVNSDEMAGYAKTYAAGARQSLTDAPKKRGRDTAEDDEEDFRVNENGSSLPVWRDWQIESRTEAATRSFDSSAVEGRRPRKLRFEMPMPGAEAPDGINHDDKAIGDCVETNSH